MTGDSRARADWLLDTAADARTSLHTAQHLLLGCWSLLEDIDMVITAVPTALNPELGDQITNMMREVGVYLETTQWVPEPTS